MLLPLLFSIMSYSGSQPVALACLHVLASVSISATDTVRFFLSLGFPSAVLMWLVVIPAHSFMQALSSSRSSLHISKYAPLPVLLPHPLPRFPSSLLQTQSSMNGTSVAILCPGLMLVGCSQICLSLSIGPD